jgi:Tfp pilus assembly protein PilE
MIVVVVLGILAAIAVPNFYSMLWRTKRASCVSNQRNILEGATLYIAEQNESDAVLNVTVLQAGDYISLTPSECPASLNKDWDDYTITIAGGAVTEIRCDVEPALHLWTDF